MPILGSVCEYMQPLANYPHLPGEATLLDLFRLLKSRYDTALQFRSVLVFDKERLLGKISLHDLLQIVLPPYLAEQPLHFEGKRGDFSHLALLWQDDAAAHLRRVAQERLADHVRPTAEPLAPSDPLTLALVRFAGSEFNTIPVAEAGRIVGVLRIVDVLAAVAATALDEEAP